MRNLLLALGFLLLSQTLLAFPVKPNPHETPGMLCSLEDRHYKERRYPERIVYCERNVKRSLKKVIYENYNIPAKQRKHYTIDHYIPLSIGGNNSINNLWPEHKLVKQLRPDLEYETYLDLKGGLITQEQAIEIIVEAKENPPTDNLP